MKIADISAEEITGEIEGTGFSGVVSLSSLTAGASLDLAFGFADRANRIPSNVATRFAMASGSKAFTAVAVGLLIDEGKIELDTRLTDCVRSRTFRFAPEITIGHLLNHTSGVPDYFSEEVQTDFAALWKERPCYSMTSPMDFLPMFENGEMKAAPGAGFLYSNSGFILLGLVIEELTGREFRDFVTERVFRPCGMTRSGYFAMDALPDNTAYGYLSTGADECRTNIYSVPSIGGSDGGAFTTTADLRLFWTSLLEGQVLRPETVDRFISPSVQVSERDESWYYGYGIWLRKARGTWIASIEGSDPGVSMESHARLSDGLIATVLSNTQDGAADAYLVLDGRISAG